DYSIFANRKVVEVIKIKVGKEHLCLLENKTSNLTLDNISFRNHMNLYLKNVHFAWVKKRQIFFSMIQPIEKAKTFLNIFFGIHSIQSFTSGFFSIVNAQIPFDSPIETDEAFLIYNGQWIIQTPTHGNKTKLNIMDT